VDLVNRIAGGPREAWPTAAARLAAEVCVVSGDAVPTARTPTELRKVPRRFIRKISARRRIRGDPPNSLEDRFASLPRTELSHGRDPVKPRRYPRIV
jgi:hypothetical protein